jgi:RNA polymerase sigma-70 factor (ECF subfamily)
LPLEISCLRNFRFVCHISVTIVDTAKADTEAGLLARCRRGEPAAWDELFDRHYAAAGRYIFQLGYGITPEDVEEICQETFFSVIRNIRNFRGGSHFQTWLFRIAANKTRDYLQRQNAAKRGGGREAVPLHTPDGLHNVSFDPPTQEPGPDAMLLNGEQSALIAEAMAKLESPARELIELRYFAGLSYEQIGHSLNVNPKTVGSRLSRCLDQLETLLSPIYG